MEQCINLSYFGKVEGQLPFFINAYYLYHGAVARVAEYTLLLTDKMLLAASLKRNHANIFGTANPSIFNFATRIH